MTQSPIKPRDLVRLLSGGPLLTVQSIVAGIATIVWFDSEGHFQRGSIAEDLIEGVCSDPITDWGKGPFGLAKDAKS